MASEKRKKEKKVMDNNQKKKQKKNLKGACQSLGDKFWPRLAYLPLYNSYFLFKGESGMCAWVVPLEIEHEKIMMKEFYAQKIIDKQNNRIFVIFIAYFAAQLI